jgi:hypothetical protein
MFSYLGFDNKGMKRPQVYKCFCLPEFMKTERRISSLKFP